MFQSHLIKITGNLFLQKILAKLNQWSLHLMGIGCGSDVMNSGEKAIFKLLKGSTTCIFDVGANKGQFLKMIVKELDGSKYTVHSFEPSKYTFQVLTDNAPKSVDLKLNNFAFGKEEGEFTLYYDKQGSGLASLSKRRLQHFGISFEKTETVKVKTIDNYCFDNSIKHIDLLKIDVEGHEMDVLTGASKMFADKAVGMVLFEFGGCNIDTRTFFQDYYYFFKNNTMDLFRITPSGYLFPIKNYSENNEQFITTNFVAIRSDLKSCE